MNIFTKHPHENGMTYIKHLFVALYYVVTSIYLTFAMLVHAFFPFWFTDTFSKTVVELYEEFQRDYDEI